MNYNHIAYARVDQHGNPVIKDSGRIEISMGSGKKALTMKNAAVAAFFLVSLASRYNIPIITEHLNFGVARDNHRYLPKHLRKLLNSFAYNLYLTMIYREAARQGVEVLHAKPAYTSLLGQANYASPYGVSVDMAAAIIIARRGLKIFQESVRPRTAHQLGLSNPKMVRNLSGKLPKREETWVTNSLARSSASAVSTALSLSKLPSSSASASTMVKHGTRDHPVRQPNLTVSKDTAINITDKSTVRLRLTVNKYQEFNWRQVERYHRWCLQSQTGSID